MKTKLFVICYLLFGLIGFAQTPDTTGQGMPKLDIPEITIVGKKAITLPFARKGEVFDVKLFQPPAPDSSLLGERLSSSLPVGIMPKEDERIQPLHASAEGAFGSFSTGKLNAFLDYRKGAWKFSGHGGFASTEGHVDNAKASSFVADVNAQTLLMTDNDALKNLQLSLGTSLLAETYGMFAYSDVERSRQNFQLMSSLGTLDRRGLTFDLALNTNVWSVKDKLPSSEEDITAVSPTLSAAFATTVGKFRWTNDLSFSSISLDYSMPTQSVTLFSVKSAVRWNISEEWSTDLGLMYADGSGILYDNRTGYTLFMPTASLLWNLGNQRQLSFWWKPTMLQNSYDDWARINPYLSREINLEPDAVPINLGISFSMVSRYITAEASLSYSQHHGKTAITGWGQYNSTLYPNPFDKGELWLESYSSNQTLLEVNATYKPIENVKTEFSGIIQPTYSTGNGEQLPMVPLVGLKGKAEYVFLKPLVVWTSFDYRSTQNVMLPGTRWRYHPNDSTVITLTDRTIDGAFLLNIGASTTIVPKTILTFSIYNLLGVSYEWWADYPAPGLRFSLEAKVNLR
jgi:hypothetical protein